MNIERMRIKLEDIDYEIVHAIWDKHCQPELPELWQMIAEIIDCANHDGDVFEAVENTLSNPQTNGFHDVPAKCEGSECGDCCLSEYDRKAVDCPYVD